MEWSESSLWDYSLSLYGKTGVERACLALQRRHGLNVNLLLLACWLADRGIELDQAVLAQAVAAVSTWQNEVVQPLRILRRRLTHQMDHGEQGSLVDRWREHVVKFRQNVLALELDGEHLAQLELGDIVSDLSATSPAGIDLAARNLAQYWRRQPEDLNDLKALLSQAFPDATDIQMSHALKALSR